MGQTRPTAPNVPDRDRGARRPHSPPPTKANVHRPRAREDRKNVFERDASKRERRGAIRDARGRFRGDDDAQVGRRAALGELEQSDGRVRARDAIRARCERCARENEIVSSNDGAETARGGWWKARGGDEGDRGWAIGALALVRRETGDRARRERERWMTDECARGFDGK